MLVGEQGSGRHTLCEYIASILNIPMQDITEIISQELIEDIYNRVNPSLYLIDGDKLSIKEENAILKFLEEPLKNSFIIVLCENTSGILPTIVNRCLIWELNGYSPNILKQIFPDAPELCLQIAKTPGQVISYSGKPFQEMLDLGDKIIEKNRHSKFFKYIIISQ